MTIEQLVGEALHAADSFEPSPDLFTKVQRSIAEDAAYRRRARRVGVVAAAAVLAIALYVAVLGDFSDGFSMSFRALEFLVTVVMIGAMLALGPAIRRFGQTYEQDAFRSNPATGTRVLQLLDIAYYLIFSAYILMSLIYDPALEGFHGFADWLQAELMRVGGFLMLMGILHVGLLVALPMAGLVFAANQRRTRIDSGLQPTDPGAERTDRAITVAAWVVAIFVVLQLVTGVLSVLLGLGASG